MAFFRRLPFFLFGFLVIWGMGFAMFALKVVYAETQEARQKMDAIIVLTGGPNRIEAGFELFSNKTANTLFISGVHPSVKKHELLAQWYQSSGNKRLPNCCLLLGQQATTTVENAQESKDWAKANNVTSIILVTSNYHMPRALMEFREALPDTFIIAHPVDQDNLDTGQWHMWKLMLSEYHKMILRWVQLKIASVL